LQDQVGVELVAEEGMQIAPLLKVNLDE